MRAKAHAFITGLALSLAVIVLGFSIAQAVREDSLGPIWMIGWLPAVLVASVYRPASAERCLPRLRRHLRS